MRRPKAHWKNYLWQSLVATLAILLVLAVLSLQRAIVVASVGATAFIVFMKPRNPFAAPRNVIGGHAVGLIAGIAFALVPHSSPAASMVLSALAVGCSMLVMALIDVEHPPASGTALSVVVTGVSWQIALAVMTSAILMALLHHFLQPYLRDL
jgi:CBS-domain-containing membrane protein